MQREDYHIPYIERGGRNTLYTTLYYIGRGSNLYPAINHLNHLNIQVFRHIRVEGGFITPSLYTI